MGFKSTTICQVDMFSDTGAMAKQHLQSKLQTDIADLESSPALCFGQDLIGSYRP
jgi:hypothetical protein